MALLLRQTGGQSSHFLATHAVKTRLSIFEMGARERFHRSDGKKSLAAGNAGVLDGAGEAERREKGCR